MNKLEAPHYKKMASSDLSLGRLKPGIWKQNLDSTRMLHSNIYKDVGLVTVKPEYII